MLNVIRKQAGSWVVKGLLLLLVLSFAIWGVGDIFIGGGPDQAVAKVGGTEISAAELSQEFDRTVGLMQRRLGGGFDRQRAIRLGLMQQTLQEMIDRRLIDLRAREMGLRIGDDLLREAIFRDPAFQTAGRFDRALFDQLLFANGLSEDGYLEVLRSDLARSALISGVTAPVVVPGSLAERLYRYRNERRSGRLVEVEEASVETVPEPSEEDLVAYLAEHEAAFTAPEYRRVSFIAIEPEDLLAEIQIDDEDVQIAYEDEIERYRTPEQRSLEQLLSNDQAVIETAQTRLDDGMAFEAIADELAGDGLAYSTLEDVVPGELPDDLDQAVFSLDDGAVSEPVQSPFGWHLIRITDRQEETTTPLAEVRDELRDRLAIEEATSRLPSLANALDDELAAGVSLEEAASTLGLEIETIDAVDDAGIGPDERRPEALPDAPEFLQVMLDTPVGEDSLLEETEDGGYFVLRVDAVTPPRVMDLDEVRDEVREAAREQARRDAAKARAEALLERVGQGETLEAVAGDAGLEIQPIEPITRNDSGIAAGLTSGIVTALFETSPGQLVERVLETDGGYALAIVDDVVVPEPGSDPEGFEALVAELREQQRSDILAQFGAALRSRYTVEVDNEALAPLLTGDGLLGYGAY